ncbi:N-acetyltransferase [Peteryoungia desertarenae]|uniref:N-acetyltransferase n=1 Tax=Peteryoungia desertarenae TaxID=1813451 RepID=A0ABX6QRE5_9HYPH|nr:GNAT family N-acetyltransferase [Peteryoungia desertarenae]QLF71118.1 N-acetyltransferase [Peteryoungia desertarenae]
MEISIEETSSGGRYVGRVEGVSDVAEMTFSRTSPRLIIIDHTGVPESLKGQGVGQALAAFAIDEARKGGWKIIPLCPFFKAQVARHPDWKDVMSF